MQLHLDLFEFRKNNVKFYEVNHLQYYFSLYPYPKYRGNLFCKAKQFYFYFKKSRNQLLNVSFKLIIFRFDLEKPT